METFGKSRGWLGGDWPAGGSMDSQPVDCRVDRKKDGGVSHPHHPQQEVRTSWMLVLARVLARRVPGLAGAAGRTVPAAATWLSFCHADFM